LNYLKRYIILAAALGIAVVVIVFAAGLFWGLPIYIESRLIPHLAETSGLTATRVRVRRIGFNGADLGPIQIEAGSGQSLSIAGIQIDYSPWGVLRKRIRGIVISGVKVELTTTSDGIGFGDADRSDASPESEEKRTIEVKTLSPVQMDYLNIVHGEVLLTHRAHRIRLPLQVDLDTTGLQEGQLSGSLRLAPYGNELILNARLDQSADRAWLRLHGESLDLRSLALVLPQQPLPFVSGKINLEAHSTVRLSTLGIETLSIRAQLRQARIGSAAAMVENLPAGAAGAVPLEIAVNQTNPGQLHWRCAPFQISTPVVTRVDALAGRWSMGESGWTLTVDSETHTPAQAVMPQWAVATPLSAQWTATVQNPPSKPLLYKVQTEAKSPVALTANGIGIRSPNLRGELHGQFSNGKLTSTVALNGNPSTLEWPTGRTRLERVSLAGGLALDTSPAAPAFHLDLKTSIKEVTAETDAARMILPAIAIEAAGGAGGGRPLQLKGRISANPGRLAGKKHPFVLDGLSFRLPFQWPPVRPPGAGRLKIDRIVHQEMLLGSLDGKIRQQKEGVTLNLEHPSKLFPGFRVLIHGAVDRQGGDFEIKAPEYELPAGFDLGRFWPHLAGMQLAGRVEASGRLKMNPGDLSATARLSVDDGAVRNQGREMALEGIQAEVQMDDLVELSSAPRQRLQVERIRLGNLDAEKLQVDFQIESVQTLFIETAGLQWCNGTMNTGALRITPGLDDYELTLFGDRLNLAMVLKQLGAAEASGDGTVNGRIPLHWSNGALTFDRGFLFSTPGKTGTIRLSGTQSLLAALPPDTPQHSQLDIATEALKDYTYKWARLYLESEGRDLLLKLQFDGKPNRLLPFAYDTGLGRFKRVSGEGEADFTGISIDLNFRSPLNEILHYRNVF
jgi:hypothetical protein